MNSVGNGCEDGKGVSQRSLPIYVKHDTRQSLVQYRSLCIFNYSGYRATCSGGPWEYSEDQEEWEDLNNHVLAEVNCDICYIKLF